MSAADDVAGRLERLIDRSTPWTQANALMSMVLAAALIRSQAERIEKLEEALTFYANRARYQGANSDPIPNDPYGPKDFVYRWDVTRDNGDVARAALERT